MGAWGEDDEVEITCPSRLRKGQCTPEWVLAALSAGVLNQATQLCNAPTELGRPDGSTGGFYGLMRDIRNLRAGVSEQLLNNVSNYRPDTRPLHDALASLRSISRPANHPVGRVEQLHPLSSRFSTSC